MSLPRPLTINELAESLGVSSMTVHRAIAGKPDIAPRTRARILAEIDRLGWKPNIAARGLRQGKTFTLGVLVSNVAASFLPEILQGVDRTAEEEGYHTIVCVHEHDLSRAERHLQMMRSKGVDGIVYYPTTAVGDDQLREAELLNEVFASTPIATIMRRVPGFLGSSVVVDDLAGGRLAADHLLELGHTRIGMVGYERSDFAELRVEGFAGRLQEAGCPISPEFTIRVPRLGLVSEAVLPLLSRSDRPAALFCASDRIAGLVLQVTAQLGIRAPGELSVLGYNGEPWTELLPVPLSTLSQPRAAVGQEAARLVLSVRTDSSSPVQVVLAPSATWRASTTPPAP